MVQTKRFIHTQICLTKPKGWKYKVLDSKFWTQTDGQPWVSGERNHPPPTHKKIKGKKIKVSLLVSFFFCPPLFPLFAKKILVHWFLFHLYFIPWSSTKPLWCACVVDGKSEQKLKKGYPKKERKKRRVPCSFFLFSLFIFFFGPFFPFSPPSLQKN